MTECVFKKFGGSYQLVLSSAADLPQILTLDPGRWAALGAPFTAFSCDPAFLRCLDADGNAFIRIDDLQAALRYAFDLFAGLEPLERTAPELEPAALNPDSAEAQRLLAFREAEPELLPGDRVTLAAVRDAIARLQTGKFRGDGTLLPDAVAGSGAEALFQAVAATRPAAVPGAVTAATLAAFEADARAFLEWIGHARLPRFGTRSPETIEAAVRPLRRQLDEYFRLCELVRLDPANQGYFRIDPAALPELNWSDPAALEAYLAAQPLARPAAAQELDLTGEVNPWYAAALETFAQVFELRRLTAAKWRELKAELAPFDDYRTRLDQDPVGRLGPAALADFLNGPQPELLRGLLREDSLLETRLGGLRAWEKALLIQTNLLTFARNFVTFQALFDASQRSLIRAGSLIMDGRRFDLAIWISDYAAHKKLAQTANLALVYVELIREPTLPTPSNLVAAVISCGEMDNIYPGRPVVFQDYAGNFHHGRVLEFLDGPVSFRQSFSLPFRRLGRNLAEKFRKYTDFNNVEKSVDSGIDNVIKNPPAAANLSKGLLSNGSMLMLAGGVSLAALGSSLAFMVKSLNQVPLPKLLIAFGVLVLIVMIPPAWSAVAKLRRRNLSRFLAAAGWVVNLKMRLNTRDSRLFSYYAPYPAPARFRRFRPKLPGGGKDPDPASDQGTRSGDLSSKP